MVREVETLRELLLPIGLELSAEDERTLEASEKLRELRKRLAERSVEIRSSGTARLILQKLGDLMDIGILEDICIKVWNEAKLFRKYLDPESYPANETIEVPVAEHTIKSTHRPHIEVRMNEVPIERIDFEIAVTLELKGAVLEIEAGTIWKIRSGECKGKAEVKCEGVLLASEKFETIKLPGVKEFKEGIAIAA